MSSDVVRYPLGRFPPTELDWSRLIPLLGPASAGLARYDGVLSAIPNSEVLLAPLTTQEAVLSSRIEGTQVSLGEVLEIEAGGRSDALTQPKRDDAEEVLNYRAAMRACVEAMTERPLSQHLVRAAHALLMQGVRGRDKSPGSYRREQNWIGNEGSPIERARFVPIDPQHLPEGMDRWERFVRDTTQPDTLVQLALIHAEFEALHPFKDGNGRLGRMLIPLFLHERGLLASPNFYMSGYLEAKRDEYYERLQAVSRDGDWTGWCVFFLEGIRRQAAENERRARAILALYDRFKVEVVELTHSHHSMRVVDFVFRSPIFTSAVFLREAEIPRQSATRILALMREKGILVPLAEGSGRRGVLHAFRELLNLAEGVEFL